MLLDFINEIVKLVQLIHIITSTPRYIYCNIVLAQVDKNARWIK